jgi:type II secretory pathway pseudopilin PulG
MKARQTGATLIETMIAIALSLVVTTAMVILMANSMGTATRGIHMTQLTDELRNTMSMLTRDVRRANYSANSIFCFGYSKCGFAGGNAPQAGDIQIDVDNQCVTFTLDRGFNGDATDDAVGGFRRVVNNGVGIIEIWTGGGGSTPNCGLGAGASDWVALTDSSVINVTNFNIDDTASITKEIQESPTSSFTSRQREIQITLQGQLVLEEARGNVVVEREIVDTVYVRNDYILPAS